MFQQDTWAAMVGSRYATAQLPDFGDEVGVPVLDWAASLDKSPGRNLALLGPVGSGKTHAAAAAARWVAEFDNRRVKFCVVVEMFDDLRPDGPETVDSLADAPLLVLDDLGIEKRSEWTDERLYAIVNRRWRYERPTIVTSNLTPDQLSEHVTERVWDRLVNGDAVRLWLGGESRRRA